MRPHVVRLIVVHEYSWRMRQRSFLVSSLALPLIVLAAIVVAIFVTTSAEKVTLPLGYVDASGVLERARQTPGDGEPRFVSLTDEAAARKAVLAGDVAAAFVIPPDYRASRAVAAYSRGDLPRQAREGFTRFLRWNLTSGLPADVAERASEGVDLAVRSLDGKREFSDATWPNTFIPLLAAILFFVTIVGNASNAMRAVIDEKESRTMELVVTSASPNEIMGGKILAILAIGMTQLAIWAAVVAIAILVAKGSIAELATFRPDPSFLVLVVLAFLPAYVLVTSLLAAAGAMASELRESQQLATMITLPTFVPTWFTPMIISSPNGALAVALSLFPLTAPLTLSIRWGFATVPAWQLAASLLLLWASAAGSVYFAARVFRAGMLRYGKRLSWQEVRQAVAGRSAR